MQYEQFERELKHILINNNGSKLLYKLIDSPYRYLSILNPFNSQTKIKQSFLRTQENKYFTFLKDAILNYFYGQFIIQDNSQDVTIFLDQEKTKAAKVRVNRTYILKDDEKKILYSIVLKKRDIYSANEALKIFSKFNSETDLLGKNYQEYKHIAFLWFFEENPSKNYSYFSDSINAMTDIPYELKVCYGSQLFSYFSKENDWNELIQNIKTFKEQNYDYFLTVPDLDKDPETLETLVNLSESLWEKLTSEEQIYIKLRKQIFNESDENSNYLKAFKLRALKATSIDEEQFKNEVLKNSLN